MQPSQDHRFRNSRKRLSAAAVAVGIAILSGWGRATQVRADGDGDQFFENRIRPQLIEHCYECHSGQADKLKASLRLDTRAGVLAGGDSGPVLVPGEPEKSLLIRAVRQSEPDLAMPPPKAGRGKLPDPVIADLAQWIKMGAPYPEDAPQSAAEGGGDPQAHWAFQPVAASPLPPVQDASWPRTAVDAFILARLEAQGISPAPPADRRALLRRATFDLLGLPPTAEEADAFIADKSPDAFARVVDRLLDSPHYGERWGRHWLDVVRYADTAGETADYPVPDAWRYRNYVIDAFNADKPYDEFLREQIAGDILAREGPRNRYAERVAATGFLAVSRRFGFDSENYHHLTIQDSIDTLGQAVLGLSLGCARCHNHKFDPVTATEYYALYGIFESTRYAFPGSEQKQKRRALAPLSPPEETPARWREYEEQIASLAETLRRQDQSPPAVVLRSLDDLDGDFEMQAPAAGGSKGVLVPPWVYAGPIAVTADAQSPFKHFHALGVVGAHIPGGTNRYRLGQALPVYLRPQRGEPLRINLEFAVVTNATPSPGRHRFWVGDQHGGPLVEVFIGTDEITLQSRDRRETLRSASSNQWRALQLEIEPQALRVSGRVGSPGNVIAFHGVPLPYWIPSQVNYVGMDSEPGNEAARPGLKLDNLGIQRAPLAEISTNLMTLAAASATRSAREITEEISRLVGHDGDFELQESGKPPEKPWGPGPNSVVMISTESQSPHQNHFPAGRLGIRLPNSGAYNGFGQTLTNHWKAASTDRLFASFDFRCVDAAQGGDGSWRFYLGHGPGSSPAVELFLNASQFFRRSGDQRDPVRDLQLGEWYQVQLELDLKAKRFTGAISSRSERTEFSGEFASAWDGSVDYTFIDSYGHRGGVKPALDADNFVIGESPLRPLDFAPLPASSDSLADRRRRAEELRRELAQASAETESIRRRLNQLLAEGPVALAYGVVEGTPQNARLQMRGEPERLGDEVPRGFVRVLGGGDLPKDVQGSGRRELADWLASSTHPLTARVMANRIWQYHFGVGLVKTPNDFGARGQRPTHPELLDFLAAEFIRSGWSIKAMHRLIMLSATYQRSAEPINSMSLSAAAAEYAAFPRRRLSAEEIRDAILLVSGELDRSPGRGHPFPSPVSWGYTQHGPFSAVYDHNQRSVYLMTQRLKRHPFLALFDGADPNASTAERRATTVPTQSLFFLNDPFVHEKAAKLASRAQGIDVGEGEQADRVFRLALGRYPSEEERADALEFLAAYRAELAESGQSSNPTTPLAALVRVLFGDNEFLHVD